MRELKYFVACTVDKFIARDDDSYDFFLMSGEQVAYLHENFPETIPAFLHEKLGINAENKCFDVVLMGRKTYEMGLKEGISNPYPQMRQYVFSHTLKESSDKNVELVSDNALKYSVMVLCYCTIGSRSYSCNAVGAREIILETKYGTNIHTSHAQ